MNGRVMIVDDSAVARAVIRSALVAKGFEVAEAVDGLEAVEQFDAVEPDVVLCDIEMPRLDGRGVLAWLQVHPTRSATPVVFLTAVDDPDDVASVLEAGAYDYLRKPFEPVELVARVHAALRTARLQDELLARNEELERLAATDTLTGLANRRLLVGELERAVARARRVSGNLAVLLVDLDRFKQVNDVHGHAAGDAVLVEVADRMRRAVRVEDVVGRWGGEEFLVVARDTDADGAQALAVRLRLEIAVGPVPIGAGQELGVTASIGWAMWRAGDDSDGIIARADRALYEAKEAGRDTVRGG